MFDCVGNSVYNIVHILMHADDATILASSREDAIRKLKCMLSYCNENLIIPQYDKCEFIVINSTENDREKIPFGDRLLSHKEHIGILGSHLSFSGDLKDDLQLHMLKRYPSVIKFYNYIRANRIAPLSVKLKVLNACVLNCLLYNAETFGDRIPEGLESTYMDMLKCAFDVRQSTPNLLMFVESGLLPIKALIHARQLKFYRRLLSTVEPEERRLKLVDGLNEGSATSYLQHYVNLDAQYTSENDIYKEHSDDIKQRIRDNAEKDRYKFQIYMEFNPDLSPSPYLKNLHPVCKDLIKFRLGSHRLPIETGRWRGIRREERICATCNVLGDEKHILFDCQLVNRNNLTLSRNFGELWRQSDIIDLFRRLKKEDFI